MKLIITLLIALILPTVSFAQKIGSWQVVLETPGMQIAKTTNDSNSVAGVICFASDKSCNAYINADVGCEENAKYPLMINAKTGANSVVATCITLDKTQFLVINELNVAVAAFESGGEVGFAVPMQNGKFRVVRFDCVGATAAIRQANTFTPEKSRTTTNQTL